jgi:hypothetical protein
MPYRTSTVHRIEALQSGCCPSERGRRSEAHCPLAGRQCADLPSLRSVGTSARNFYAPRSCFAAWVLCTACSVCPRSRATYGMFQSCWIWEVRGPCVRAGIRTRCVTTCSCAEGWLASRLMLDGRDAPVSGVGRLQLSGYPRSRTVVLDPSSLTPRRSSLRPAGAESQMADPAETAEQHLGPSGRLISRSKSGFRAAYAKAPRLWATGVCARLRPPVSVPRPMRRGPRRCERLASSHEGRAASG